MNELISKRLRHRVRSLSTILGKTMTDQYGQGFLDKVEEVRLLAKANRQSDVHDTEVGDHDELRDVLTALDDGTLISIARAFNQFLNLTNIAEQTEATESHPGSQLEDLFQRLVEQEVARHREIALGHEAPDLFAVDAREARCGLVERADQLDMRGNPDSGGIWAPCLSYADGLFWLIYTDMKRLDGNYKDSHNYLVTCPTIDGEWSTRTYMNSSGFDPSLFHDDDGRKWFVNMVWDHRGYMEERDPPRGMFNGILLQEYDHDAGKLIGPIKRIFGGSPHGMTEAPHLFKRGEYYYLVTAEGGTGYEHAVTHARSRSIDGPYELHPDWHPLTARKSPEAFVQRVGHGQSVETPDGRTFHSFLMGRPLPEVQRCPRGRETGVREMEGRDDGGVHVLREDHRGDGITSLAELRQFTDLIPEGTPLAG